MSDCPVCGQPMSPYDTWWHHRTHCSRRCSAITGAAVVRARESEVDDVVVWRLIDGIPVASTRGERLEAVRQLTSRGYSLFDIASRLHTTDRSVSRYRAELNRRAVAA